ncbi:hypothetical protein OpiT1DRAFT_05441 [Opitutaceae bacterium TAV1]|nr:hypothetical protein OpiT1DRAFT_05441 [Opitutaceae bacterium TAV1]
MSADAETPAKPAKSPLVVFPAEKIVFSLAELMAMTGLDRVTVWRLEKQGLLRAAPGVGSKLYSRQAVEAWLNGKESPAA